MLFTSVVLVILISIILLIHHWSQNKGIVYLVMSIIFLSLRQITFLLVNSEGHNALVPILHIHIDFLNLLIGPCMLYYIKSLVQGKIVVDKYLLIHAIPALLALINTLPYYSYPFENKVAYFTRVQEILVFNSNNFPYLILPLKYQGMGIFVFNFSYVLVCIAYLVRLKKNSRTYLKKKLSVILQRILAFILIVSIPYLIMMIYILVNSPQTDGFIFKQSAFKGDGYLFFITLLLPLSFFLMPSWLYNYQERMNVFDKIRLLLKRFREPAIGTLEASKYEKAADMERIVTYIEKEKPYVQVNFSLHDISQVLNIPHIRVTNAFNQQLKTSFPVYRNKLRLAHAISLLRDGAHFTNSIEGIAARSGFKSRSIFYLAFKEEYGMTPTEWIKKNL
jgi:AraC-like DNA-binding protein